MRLTSKEVRITARVKSKNNYSSEFIYFKLFLSKFVYHKTRALIFEINLKEKETKIAFVSCARDINIALTCMHIALN